MSLSLANLWIQQSIRSRAARDEAWQLLASATRDGIDGTLIVGPKLSVNGRCYLARWDGEELVVLELTDQQQSSWNVQPRGLYRELHGSGMPMPGLVSERLVTLAFIRLDTPTYDAWAPLSGACRVQIERPGPLRLENLAIRAKYFRPGMKSSVTAMSYTSALLVAPGGEMKFQFPPLISPHQPYPASGPLLIFLQLFSADDWVAVSGCRKISNILPAMIQLE
jgi:hypothetical protein